MYLALNSIYQIFTTQIDVRFFYKTLTCFRIQLCIFYCNLTPNKRKNSLNIANCEGCHPQSVFTPTNMYLYKKILPSKGSNKLDLFHNGLTIKVLVLHLEVFRGVFLCRYSVGIHTLKQMWHLAINFECSQSYVLWRKHSVMHNHNMP